MCVLGGSVSGAFRHDRAITRPGGDTLCESLCGVLSNTNNCAVKPLFSELLGKVWQKVKDKREFGRGDEKREREGEREVLSWRSN